MRCARSVSIAPTAAQQVRPQLAQEVAVAGQPEHLDHAPDELAVAVVLDRLIDAVPVDRARHAPVGELEGRVPAQERARLVGEAHLRERRAGERAVADPRAPIAARAGLDARPFAVDQDPGDRGAQAVGHARGAARQLDRNAAPGGRASAASVSASRASTHAAAASAVDAAGRGRRRVVQRHRDADGGDVAGVERQVEGERRFGEADRIVDRGCAAGRSPSVSAVSPSLGRRRADRVGPCDRDDAPRRR